MAYWKQSNALRKEVDMAFPVQDATTSSLEATNGRVALQPVAMPQRNTRAKNKVQILTQRVRINRNVAPLSLLAFLVLVFFVSPLLPTGIHDYISALLR
jgi:hypothetical protein